MQVKEAIILAGGLGTRLRPEVPDLPKCMAPVAGKPFLCHVMDYCRQQGLERLIFSLGYRHEVIENYMLENCFDLSFVFSVEDEPLGTGGAIKKACKLAQSEHVVILNGDTLFHVNLSEMAAVHEQKNADCTLALKPMKAFDRYGVVEYNSDLSVKSFREKQFYESGTINGGVYILNTAHFIKEPFPDKFSFEKDYLEPYYNKRPLFAVVQDAYFIDIGIPEDYKRAQTELKS